jgi:hypothetical protein
MRADDRARSRRERRGWLTALFAEVFATRPSIPEGRYLMLNAFGGLFLLLLAALILGEPRGAGRSAAFALGASGFVLEISLLVSTIWRSLTPRLLAFHGFLLVSLALASAITSIDWALQAPPLSPFRYAPGLILVLMTYGMLQVAAFGPWTRGGRQIRLAGVVAGLVCELLVLVSFVVRAVR